MDLPADVPEPIDVTDRAARRARHRRSRRPRSSRVGKVLALTDAAAVRTLAPDFAAIARARRGGRDRDRGRPTSPELDFVSRYFAPGVGIDEDPVTGAAHCALAPFWAARLGRDELVGYQASKRGGTVRCRVDGDRVVLGGHAVTVTRGELARLSRLGQARARERVQVPGAVDDHAAGAAGERRDPARGRCRTRRLRGAAHRAGDPTGAADRARSTIHPPAHAASSTNGDVTPRAMSYPGQVGTFAAARGFGWTPIANAMRLPLRPST